MESRQKVPTIGSILEASQPGERGRKRYPQDAKQSPLKPDANNDLQIDKEQTDEAQTDDKNQSTAKYSRKRMRKIKL